MEVMRKIVRLLSIFLLIAVLTVMLCSCTAPYSTGSGAPPSQNTPSDNIPPSENEPDEPTIPDTPEVPDTPEEPDTPDVPSQPPYYVPGTLQIEFIDVGQGDSIFIMFPDGKSMLIDAGAQIAFGVPATVKKRIRNYGITDKIDYLMLTHPHYDHVNALDSLLKTFDFNVFFVPPLKPYKDAAGYDGVYGYYDTESYRDFCTQMQKQVKRGAKIHYNVDTFSIAGENYSFDFYCANEAQYAAITDESSNNEVNNLSPIGFLNCNGMRYCFTGDAEDVAEKNFISKYVTKDNKRKFASDVLKVAHHGSKTSSTAEFLELIKPHFAVISVGTNVTGHPNDDVLYRLRKLGAHVYTTSKYGSTAIRQDKTSVTVLPQTGAGDTLPIPNAAITSFLSAVPSASICIRQKEEFAAA